MCVIIVKPEGIRIKDHDLDRAWASNHHGAGIVLPGNPPRMVKGLMKLRDLKDALEEVGSRHAIVHLRFATHGAINGENTHPFRVSDRRWLMHNGILSAYGSHGELGQSDSAHLATDLGPLTNGAIRRILNTIPGKFAFVDRSSVSIHGKFEEHADCEWSNLHWLGQRYAKVYGHGDFTRARDWYEEKPKKKAVLSTTTMTTARERLINQVLTEDRSVLLTSDYALNDDLGVALTVQESLELNDKFSDKE